MEQMTFEESITVYLKSGFPLVYIDTLEVDRATQTIRGVCADWNKALPVSRAPKWLKDAGYTLHIWDRYNGIYIPDMDHTNNIIPTAQVARTDAPDAALKYILTKEAPPGIYVLHNFHFQLDDPYVKPMLIQLMTEICRIGRNTHKRLFLIGNISGLPPELSQQAVTVEFRLPAKPEITEYIQEYVESMGLTNIKKKVCEKAAEAAAGMSMNEVEGALCVTLVKSKGTAIDTNLIFAEKAKAVRKSGLLEYIPNDLTLKSAVGGLGEVKAWLDVMAKPFTEKARAEKYGLPTPKGCLFIGLSGCGKTLSAKATANRFGVPLFRCDVGRVFGSLVGETESKTRELFRLAEAVSPCVILLDEVEKSLSGLGSSDSSDSGVTARFIGNLLYWLEEKSAPVFIVATGNDVRKIPPELLRKGR